MQKDGNYQVDVTDYLLSLENDEYKLVGSQPDVMAPYFIPAMLFGVTTGTQGNINSTGVTGHSMTDGELSTTGYVPIEVLRVDITKALNIQVVWCGINGTTTQGVTWKVTYDADAIESGVLTAPATVLDTVIVEDNENDTPYVMQKTSAGIIAANTLSAGEAIAFRAEADLVDSASDPGCWFIGLLLTQ